MIIMLLQIPVSSLFTYFFLFFHFLRTPYVFSNVFIVVIITKDDYENDALK